MFGPVLRGAHVTLRPPDDSDPPRYVEWLADLEVTRYLGMRFAMALFQEEEFFKKAGESKTDVIWTIEAEGRAIGASGIHQIDWKDARGITGTIIGDKTAWRKGYGSESMALRTEYAFRWLNLHKLESSAYAENGPSRRALTKAGYREVGIQREHSFREGRWLDHWLCELLRSDWEKMRSEREATRVSD